MDLLFKIPTVLTVVLSFGLGVFTLLRNPQSPVNRLWFATSLAVTVWSVGYFFATVTSDPGTAYRYVLVLYTGATLIPMLYLNFISRFLLRSSRLILGTGYVAAFVLLALIYFSDSVISGTRYLSGFGYYEDIGHLFPLYLFYFFGLTLATAFLLMRGYLQADGIRRRQIFFLLLATLVGVGDGVTNFVTDLFGELPYGQVIVPLYPILITYGIFTRC